MVRLKNRYILVEFITDGGRIDDGFTGRIFLDIIRDAIGTVHGDKGVGLTQYALKGTGMRMKCNNAVRDMITA
jgi:hypothetical protein